MKKTYLLNAPICTGWGTYSFTPLNIEGAKKILNGGFVSAVGHQSTADFLAGILDMPVPCNRVQVNMTAGDQAVVLRLRSRLPEGVVLSEEEMRGVDYDLCLLSLIGGLR
jgi:hypothetical protein